MNKTLMVMAGGTGGHVYPAMAVADYLKAKGWNIVWLCTEGGMENRLIASKDYQKAMITMRGVRGKGLLGWVLLPVKLSIALVQSYKAIAKFQPNLVLGMGGFAAFPGGLMAWISRKPLVIHEQNSVAGLTNKTLAHFAKRVLTAFPAAFGSKALLVGNPVRADITEIVSPVARLEDHTGQLRLLVVGGSLGAQALNDVLPKALAEIAPESRPLVVHQAGEKHITALQANYQVAGVSADTKAFIQDMAAMYSWADIVICRSGALTIAEVSAAGVASVLVPFPHAVDDHQTSNAHYLSEAGAAILIPQPEFTVAKVVTLLQNLTRKQCLAMAIKARALGKPEATATVANICLELAL
ncbi:MAG: undecaprenyldiphospho-muramoylpentapeptide beta-N-acetylglucosaminyltransferase [Bacteroidia bacterium]|nr:undecaprenyldiphospho-muramoylpentapeptide beta-N-acetylglucosaminyltransferase [Methylotenera sp.]